MTNSDEELAALVSRLDPTAADPPPAPGSPRYDSILERAMSNIDATPTNTDATPNNTDGQDRPRRQRSRWLAAGIAAAVVAATIGVVAVQASDAPPAAAVVADAAGELAQVTSLQGELTSTSNGNDRIARIKMDGGEFELSGETLYADGHTESSTFTVVDGGGYETIDGETSKRSVEPQELPAPFAPSSAAVISAALEGSEVAERGVEQIDGVSATRYDIALTDTSVAALSELTPNELAWFELEYPELVTKLVVWVADDIIRQIEVTQEPSRGGGEQGAQITRTRFFDLNGDIMINAPPGPYTERDD